MIEQLNIRVFRAINFFAGHNAYLDKLGIAAAKYLFTVPIVFLIYLWLKGKEYKNIALFLGYAAILGILLNFFTTLFYFHPRPFMENIGKLLVNHAPETSFPSDHTTFMLAIAFMSLYFRQTRKMGIGLFLLGIWGGTARVFCGLHFPLDILGSVFIAMISSYIVFLAKGRLRKVNKLILGIYFALSRFFVILKKR